MPIHAMTLNEPQMNLAGDIYEPVILLNPHMIYVHATARVDSFCKLEGGEGIVLFPLVHVASFCHLNIGGGELIMERGSSCGSGCRIVTGSSKYGAGRGCSAVDPQVVVEKGRVIIKRNATLYAGCLVRPNVTIGEGSTVAMGSVVLCDVPPGELWGGNPARRLKPRTTGISDFSKITYASKIVSEDRFVESTLDFIDGCYPV